MHGEFRRAGRRLQTERIIFGTIEGFHEFIFKSFPACVEAGGAVPTSSVWFG
jgi:hypothetical protein